jgi:hypothetical protein
VAVASHRETTMTEKHYVSGSALPLAAKCPSSAVLPKVLRISSDADMGTALHEHMRDRVVLGMSEAVRRLDAIADVHQMNDRERNIFRGRAYSFEWNPPRGALAEVALCLCEDGRVVVTSGGRGQYDELPPGAVIPMQIDVFWAEPEPLYRDGERIVCPPGSVLWCVDLKTGDSAHVATSERNMQTLAGMVAAARLTGAKMAIPAIIYWGKGQGIWDVPEHPLDAAGIDAAEQIVRTAVARVDEQRRRYLAGEPMAFTTGEHCTWCDAQTHCPAKVSAIKRLLDDPQPLLAAPLTDLQARSLAEMLASIEHFAKAAREALVSYTDRIGPIDVGHGKAWGPYQEPRGELDPVIARQVLDEEIGPAAAALAFGTATSRAKLEGAIKAAHAATGVKRQASAAMRRVMAGLKERGGLIDGIRTCYGVHQAELPSGPPPAPQLAAGPIEIDGDD